MKIPDSVLQLLTQHGIDEIEEVPFRGLSSSNGELGETYFFINDRELIAVSRLIGHPWELQKLPLAKLEEVNLKVDSPFLYLDLAGSGIPSINVKASILDEDKIRAFLTLLEERCESARTRYQEKRRSQIIQTGDNVSPEQLELTPQRGFFAAVYAMIQSDQDISEEELKLIENMADDPALPLQGLALLQEFGPEELFRKLGTLLNDQQKLCLMANLIEMAMVDGVVHSPEKRMLKLLKEILKLSDEEYEAIFNVLLIKNRRTVFLEEN